MNNDSKRRLKVMALTVPAAIVYIILGALLPVFIIAAVIGVSCAQKEAESRGYETGVTDEGYFRLMTDAHYTTQTNFKLAGGGEDMITRRDSYRKGYYDVWDYEAVKDGSADYVYESYSTQSNPGDVPDDYFLYHIMTNGGRVILAKEEKITAVRWEELTGQKANGRDRSMTEKYLTEALKGSGELDKLNPPATGAEIAAWENNNGCKLPQHIKDFLMFSNGFKYGKFEVLPLEKISPNVRPKDCEEEYFTVGRAYGTLLSDKDGDLCQKGSYNAKFFKYIRSELIPKINQKNPQHAESAAE
ncbi:MAG: SMI1/KNR4 family protein [Ruminococcus sp.]|nr:SMI1/KNR4 family protein [Ruminococcus sp.]